MKKYNGTEWVDTTLRQYKTATDTFTTLPADVYADGTNATLTLKGNTVQSGTPSPTDPIQPQECGERTGNLYDYSTIVPGYTYDSNGQMILNPDTDNRWRFAAVPLIEVEPGATYLRTYNLTPFGNAINFYDSNKNFIERATPGTGMPISIPSNCNFVTYVIQTEDMDVEKYMFIKSSTAPTHFEPYGYKIPISSGGVTTNIYLGSTQTTRQIKKYTFTGEESWTYYGPFGTYNHKHFYIDLGGFTTIPMTDDILLCCNTYTATNNVNNIGNYCCRYQQSSSGGWNINRIYFTNDDYNSLDDVITALRNNPIILYIIATQETTGIVNEPLMKIGDYADTVSGISIPTITSKDTFDVDTTLKPSEVSLSYTGWHDATVEEWDGSQWNE